MYVVFIIFQMHLQALGIQCLVFVGTHISKRSVMVKRAMTLRRTTTKLISGTDYVNFKKSIKNNHLITSD